MCTFSHEHLDPIFWWSKDHDLFDPRSNSQIQSISLWFICLSIRFYCSSASLQQFNIICVQAFGHLVLSFFSKDECLIISKSNSSYIHLTFYQSFLSTSVFIGLLLWAALSLFFLQPRSWTVDHVRWQNREGKLPSLFAWYIFPLSFASR